MTSLIHYVPAGRTPGDLITAACGKSNEHHPNGEILFHTSRNDWVTCGNCVTRAHQDTAN